MLFHVQHVLERWQEDKTLKGFAKMVLFDGLGCLFRTDRGDNDMIHFHMRRCAMSFSVLLCFVCSSAARNQKTHEESGTERNELMHETRIRL